MKMAELILENLNSNWKSLNSFFKILNDFVTD